MNNSWTQISVNSSVLHPGAKWQKTRAFDKKKKKKPHPNNWENGVPFQPIPVSMLKPWLSVMSNCSAQNSFLWSQSKAITATSGSIRKLVFVQVGLWLLIWHSAHLCVCQARHGVAIDWPRPGQSGWVCARRVISDITPRKSSVCLSFPLSIVWGVH